MRSKGKHLPSGKWIELRNKDRDSVGALVPMGRQASQELQARLETFDAQYRLPQARLNPLFVNQLASATPAIHAALQSGQVFQVVGPPALVRGLNIGTHRILRSKGKLLGTVVQSESSRISGQLRFLPKSTSSVVAPLVAYQVLHAIAGTTELRRITERLDAIERGIQTVLLRQEADVLGRITWAISTLDDLFEEHVNTGGFSQEMMLRLAHVETTIGPILQRQQILIEAFRSKTKQVLKRTKKAGADATATLLAEEGRLAHTDMRLLIGLASADLRVQAARIHCAMQHTPGDVTRRMTQADEKVLRYRGVIKNLPSIKTVVKHAEACVKEMSWFSRHITARGVVQRVKNIKGLRRQELSLPESDLLHDTPASYVLWLDEAGNPQACVIDERSNVPIVSGQLENRDI